MKKLTLIFLSIICVLCLAFPLTACENEQVSQGLEYEIYGDRCRVVGIGTFEGDNLVIPSKYEGKPVTSIGQRAFYDCKQLTSISLPSSITHIGNKAFDGCTIKKASISSYLISQIPHDALETVIIKSGNKIPDSAFLGCTSLTKITLPTSVTSIGYSAFSGCTSLSSINIPNGVASIGYSAFFGCTSLTSITIPDSVTFIDKSAFGLCKGLTSISVNKNNKTYHSQNNCLIEIASKTLVLGCKNSVIPDDGSVTSIGDKAFSYYENMTSITIPNSITSIGGWAFWGCGGLTSITIPKSVTSIGAGAFTECGKLTSVIFEDTLNWHEEDKLIDVTNPSNNANNLRENYYYTWTKMQ